MLSKNYPKINDRYDVQPRFIFIFNPTGCRKAEQTTITFWRTLSETNRQLLGGVIIYYLLPKTGFALMVS